MSKGFARYLRSYPEYIPLDKPVAPHYLFCFMLGALSGFVAAWGNTLYIGIYAPFIWVSRKAASWLGACLIAPVIEELVKPLGLFMLRSEERVKLPTIEWAKLGLVAGLGFALLENSFYVVRALLEQGVAVALVLLAVRTVLSLPMHVVNTSVVGYGFGWWSNTNEPARYGICLSLAIVHHGVYNAFVLYLGEIT